MCWAKAIGTTHIYKKASLLQGRQYKIQFNVGYFLIYTAQIKQYPKSIAPLPPASGKAKANTIHAEYTLWLKCSYTAPKTAQKAETAKYAHAVFIYDFLTAYFHIQPQEQVG